MSAYVVSKSQITTLVAAGAMVAKGTINIDREGASRIGADLLAECIASVSYRYPKDDLGELPGMYVTEAPCEGVAAVEFAEWLTPYVYEPPETPPTREEVEAEIGCYEYQSCEHPGWEASFAAEYCRRLRAALDHIPAAPPPPNPFEGRDYGALDRNDTIRRIREALKRRSGKSWSVTGGRGTAWGWIHIQAPPKRRTGAHVQKPGAGFGEYEHIDTGKPQEFGLMTPQDCAELGELLGLGRPCHPQGESVPASGEYRREYIDRAEGRPVVEYAAPYWD